MGSLIRMVGALQDRLGVTPDRWVPGPPLWVVAVDYDAGRRVVFGRAGGPPASVAEAVLASCSIPGWFTPQVIDGRRYVDGGVASSTSVGLLARPGAPALDEVYVLAPMAGHDLDHPRDPVARVERAMRRVLTRWLDAEVRAVRATGARVVVITPGPADLRAMGGNMMNPRPPRTGAGRARPGCAGRAPGALAPRPTRGAPTSVDRRGLITAPVGRDPRCGLALSVKKP